MKKGSRVGQELKGIGSSKDLEVVTHGDSLTTCRWKAPKTSDCGSADWVLPQGRNNAQQHQDVPLRRSPHPVSQNRPKAEPRSLFATSAATIGAPEESLAWSALVLVDSGSTDNLIMHSFAKALGLPSQTLSLSLRVLGHQYEVFFFASLRAAPN